MSGSSSVQGVMHHWQLGLMHPVVICMWKIHDIMTSRAFHFRPESSRAELFFLVWEVCGGFLQVQNQFWFLLSLKLLQVLQVSKN